MTHPTEETAENKYLGGEEVNEALYFLACTIAENDEDVKKLSALGAEKNCY